jgi:hypothetical protein
MAKKMSKSAKKTRAAFREVTKKEPKVVAKTRAKKGAKAASKQKVAIALNKARAAGARIPQRGRGKR